MFCKRIMKASYIISKVMVAQNTYWNLFISMSQWDKNELHLAFQLCTNVLDYALWGWYMYFYLDNHMSGSTIMYVCSCSLANYNMAFGGRVCFGY